MRSRPRLIPLALLVACLLPLHACAAPVENPADSLPSSESLLESATPELYAHYDALVSALRDELANLRTDTALTTEALLCRIEALEAALESLGIDLPLPSAPTDPSHPDPSLTDSIPESLPLPESASESSGESFSVIPGGTYPEIPPDETAGADAPTDPQAYLLYRITGGTVTITGYHAVLPSHITIPAAIEGYPVTAIADHALANAEMQSVTLPATLTHIGWFAFSNCQSLRTVTIPASVMNIGYGAFDGCRRLVLYCPPNSYAARYAAASALSYVEV